MICAQFLFQWGTIDGGTAVRHTAWEQWGEDQEDFVDQKEDSGFSESL